MKVLEQIEYHIAYINTYRLSRTFSLFKKRDDQCRVQPTIWYNDQTAHFMESPFKVNAGQTGTI